jgi:hypothetical protein
MQIIYRSEWCAEKMPRGVGFSGWGQLRSNTPGKGITTQLTLSGASSARFRHNSADLARAVPFTVGTLPRNARRREKDAPLPETPRREPGPRRWRGQPSSRNRPGCRGLRHAGLFGHGVRKAGLRHVRAPKRYDGARRRPRNCV